MIQPTVSERERVAAQAAVPCPHPVGAATCPFNWNSCRRTGRCDVAEDVATALAQAREDALREAAGKCDEMARSAERSRAAAALAGRESVASRRQSDVETAEALAGEIRALITPTTEATHD